MRPSGSTPARRAIPSRGTSSFLPSSSASPACGVRSTLWAKPRLTPRTRTPRFARACHVRRDPGNFYKCSTWNILKISRYLWACGSVVEHGIRIAETGVRFSPGPPRVNPCVGFRVADQVCPTSPSTRLPLTPPARAHYVPRHTGGDPGRISIDYVPRGTFEEYLLV